MSWFRPKKPSAPGSSTPDEVVALPAPSVAALPAGRDDDLDDDGDDEGSAPVPEPAATRAAAPAAPPRIESPPFDPSGATRLGDDTHVTGGVVTASDLWVAGRIEGDISSGATVVVAADGAVVGNVAAVSVRIEPGGAVHGMITADNVSVGGVVQGPIRAAARLAIATSGRVVGDVSATSIQIDDGATLQGRCTMARTR
jgi:cytoskeletal protein CcmA (bactofilin family)